MTRGRLLLVLAVAALLVPALQLTVVALAQPASGPGVIAVSFTPWAIPLYGGALVVLLAVLLRRRTRQLAGLVVLAALGLCLHLFWGRDYVVGDTAAHSGETVTVATANVLYGDADPTSVMTLAMEQDVDVLVVVELDAQLLASLEERGIDELYPHRFGWASPGAEGTMVWSRLPITRGKGLDMPLASLDVQVETDQGPLTLLGVHVQRPSFGGAAGWVRDLKALRRVVADVEGPLVLMGDFNATLEHRPLAGVLEAGDLVDSVQATDSGWRPTWPSNGVWNIFGLPLPSLVQIDHVLTNGDVDVHESSTYELPGTDHRAVVARISLAGSG